MDGSGKSKSKQTLAVREMRGRLNAYLLRNRGRQQYRHAPSAAQAASRVMRPLAKKFGAGVGTLRDHWPEIVGQKWAQLSQPHTLRGAKDAKILVIKAKGPAATLISANSDQLLAKINQFLGAGSVRTLKIIQSRMSGDTPAASAENNVRFPIAKPGENTLEAALDRLGANFKTQADEKTL